MGRRTRLADLTFTHFTHAKLADGRLYAWYWDEDEVRHTLYRYQWVWMQNRGPIPDGMVVHHDNGLCTDDRIENLKLMTALDHSKLHGLERRGSKAPWWTCRNCGKRFQRNPSTDRPVRKFCSKACFSIRKNPNGRTLAQLQADKRSSCFAQPVVASGR